MHTLTPACMMCCWWSPPTRQGSYAPTRSLSPCWHRPDQPYTSPGRPSLPAWVRPRASSGLQATPSQSGTGTLATATSHMDRTPSTSLPTPAPIPSYYLPWTRTAAVTRSATRCQWLRYPMPPSALTPIRDAPVSPCSSRPLPQGPVLTCGTSETEVTACCRNPFTCSQQQEHTP